MKKIISFTFLPVFILVLLSFYHLVTAQASHSRPRDDKQFTLLGTGDLQGRMEPSAHTIKLGIEKKQYAVVGGIERIATIIEDCKSRSTGSICVVSSGDDLMGRFFHFFQGKAIFTLMNQAGYDIIAFGNHEFDHGPGTLAESLENTGFTPLCSDLSTTDSVMKDHCKNFILRPYDGFMVGFFSLMTEDFPFVTSAGNVELIGANISTARKMVATLRQEGADLIIAISHIGLNQDRKVARAVDGIDIIFGGHSHSYLEKMEKIGDTYIINGGEKGSAVVRLDLSLDRHNQILANSVRYSLIPVKETTQTHPEVSHTLETFVRQLPETIILGTTETVWDLSKQSLRSGESPVADMINDLVLAKFDVDLVLNNAGLFRGQKQYPAGNVTDKMLHEIDEFNNDIYLLEISGKYIREILEHSANLIGKGGFLQIGGIRFTLDTGGQSQQLSQIDQKWQVTSIGNKVSNITILDKEKGWLPLDPQKEYRMASNGFLVRNGGDHYFWFNTFGSNIRNSYSTVYSVLAETIANQKVLNPTDPDGRIQITGP